MLRTKMARGGKIVIPAAYRKQLHIKPGDDMIFELQGHQVIITSLRAMLEQSRQLVRKYVDQQQPSNVERHTSLDVDTDINTTNTDAVASTDL